MARLAPLKVLGEAEDVLKLAGGAQAVDALHHARPLVLAHPPLKEVGLAPVRGEMGRGAECERVERVEKAAR